MRKIGCDANFKTFTGLLMHVAINYCLCSIAFNKGKHVIVRRKKKKRCEGREVTCFSLPWVYYFSLYICMFTGRTTRMLCDHLNPCHEKKGLTYFISVDMEMCTQSVICYTYCSILDMLFLTTELPNVKMFMCHSLYYFVFHCFSSSEDECT